MARGSSRSATDDGNNEIWSPPIGVLGAKAPKAKKTIEVTQPAMILKLFS